MRLLIDGIVRQATVLLAQVSTAFGARAPMSHVADQVFYELAREIECHGVRRQVVADMFGMALRSYQKKMLRLGESRSAPERTLWEAVLAYIEQHEPTRAEILRRFHHDGERATAAVLTDLVRTGLCFVTGEGDATRYGITREELRHAIQRTADIEATSHVVWLKVFHREPVTRGELRALLPDEPQRIDDAIAELLAGQRLQQISAEGDTEGDGDTEAPSISSEDRFDAANVVLPREEEQGFEAAALDHFRAVCNTLGMRLGGMGQLRPDPDKVGGSTFTFTVTPTHPQRDRVPGLLQRQRAEVQALWDEVSRHNTEQPPGDATERVTFYLGQHVVEENET